MALERSQQVLLALQLQLGIAAHDIMRARRLDALNQAGYVNVQWSLDVRSVTDMQVGLIRRWAGRGRAGGCFLPAAGRS